MIRTNVKKTEDCNLEDCSNIKNTDLCKQCYEIPSHVLLALYKNFFKKLERTNCWKMSKDGKDLTVLFQKRLSPVICSREERQD